MRLAGTKEAGYPDAIGSVIVFIGIQKVLQPFLHLFGQNIFFNLK